MYSYKKKSFWNEYGEVILKLLLRLFVSLMVALVISGLIYFVLFHFHKMENNSMNPSYPKGKTVLISKYFSVSSLTYQNTVAAKVLQSEAIFIGRIVAKPGDRIYIKNKKIYRNGKLVKESGVVFSDTRFAFPIEFSKRDNTEDITLGKDEFYILCDNRDECMDSREYGSIKPEGIIGKIVY